MPWYYTALLVASLVLGLMKSMYELNRPTDEEVQRRTQKGLADLELEKQYPWLRDGWNPSSSGGRGGVGTMEAR